MLSEGKVKSMVVSRMFWFRFIVPKSDIPMLENVVFNETEEVRVLCVIACGLYRLDKLFLS